MNEVRDFYFKLSKGLMMHITEQWGHIYSDYTTINSQNKKFSLLHENSENVQVPVAI